MKVARNEEMQTFGEHLYVKRPIEDSIRETGKPPIGVRWVDINKGDNTSSNYRCRFVVRDVKKKGDNPMCAPIAPLEALRTIFSMAATKDGWQ